MKLSAQYNDLQTKAAWNTQINGNLHFCWNFWLCVDTTWLSCFLSLLLLSLPAWGGETADSRRQNCWCSFLQTLVDALDFLSRSHSCCLLSNTHFLQCGQGLSWIWPCSQTISLDSLTNHGHFIPLARNWLKKKTCNLITWFWSIRLEANSSRDASGKGFFSLKKKRKRK